VEILDRRRCRRPWWSRISSGEHAQQRSFTTPPAAF